MYITISIPIREENNFYCMSWLEGHDAGLAGDPVQVRGNAGEAGREADLAAERRAERDDTDLGEDAILGDVAERATAVAVARAVTVGGADAQVIGRDDGAVHRRTGRIGDDGRVGLAKHRADARGGCIRTGKIEIVIPFLDELFSFFS